MDDDIDGNISLAKTKIDTYIYLWPKFILTENYKGYAPMITEHLTSSSTNLSKISIYLYI